MSVASFVLRARTSMRITQSGSFNHFHRHRLTGTSLPRSEYATSFFSRALEIVRNAKTTETQEEKSAKPTQKIETQTKVESVPKKHSWGSKASPDRRKAITIKSLEKSGGETVEIESALEFAISNNQVAVVESLLENRADPNVPNSKGWTPLITASRRGLKEIVKLLIEKGADLNACTYQFLQTPLHLAVSNNHLEVVKILLEKGASTEFTDYKGLTPLCTAANLEHVEIVKALLEGGADPNVLVEDRQSVLHHAITFSNAKIVKLLLDYGADVHHTDSKGFTPLILASHLGQVEMVKHLIEKGSDVLYVTEDFKQTALGFAAANNYHTIAELLIKHGADIDQQNLYGWTPLLTATGKGHNEMVKLLLAKGAKVNEVTFEYGQSALELNAKTENVAIASALLDKGAEIDLPNKMGWTPLITASSLGCVEMVKLLVKRGASVNATTSGQQQTALDLAASKNFYQIIKILLENGADVNQSDIKGWTPLITATNQGCYEAAKILLERGANVNALLFEHKQTALDIAANKNKFKIAKLLLDHGANVNLASAKGFTPLITAADQGFVDVAKVLLDAGADTEARTTQHGSCALHMAVLKNKIQVVKLLLDHGANLNNQDLKGTTPLMIAAQKNRPEIFKLLRDRGADLQLVDSLQKTALDIATEMGHKSICALFPAV